VGWGTGWQGGDGGGKYLNSINCGKGGYIINGNENTESHLPYNYDTDNTEENSVPAMHEYTLRYVRPHAEFLEGMKLWTRPLY